MVFAALNAPELQESLKLSLASAPLPPRPLLSALAGLLLPRAGVVALAGHFRSMLKCMLNDKIVLIVVSGEICQNTYITDNLFCYSQFSLIFSNSNID